MQRKQKSIAALELASSIEKAARSVKAPSSPEESDLPEELQGLDTAAMDLESLGKLDRALDGFLRTIRAHDGELPAEMKMWAALVRLKMDLRACMAKLRPPPAVDPSADPLSLAARDAVLEKLRRAVAVHRPLG